LQPASQFCSLLFSFAACSSILQPAFVLARDGVKNKKNSTPVFVCCSPGAQSFFLQFEKNGVERHPSPD
jgi:hypothetical protein